MKTTTSDSNIYIERLKNLRLKYKRELLQCKSLYNANEKCSSGYTNNFFSHLIGCQTNQMLQSSITFTKRETNILYEISSSYNTQRFSIKQIERERERVKTNLFFIYCNIISLQKFNLI